MPQPEHIEVECLTDESGTAYAVSFYVGQHKVYSKWTRLASAEKLARTLRNAFSEGPAMDPEAARTAGVTAAPCASIPVMPASLWDAINELHEARIALTKRRESGEKMNADHIDRVTAAEQRIDSIACGVAPSDGGQS